MIQAPESTTTVINLISGRDEIAIKYIDSKNRDEIVAMLQNLGSKLTENVTVGDSKFFRIFRPYYLQFGHITLYEKSCSNTRGF